MLDPKVMAGRLMKAGDATIGILKDVSSRDARDAQGVFPLDLPWEECWAGDILAEWGYAEVRATDARQNEDGHRRLTGIIISDEVLSVFREVYTRELDQKRRNLRAVLDCCFLAKMYYETAPIGVVMEVYKRYAEAKSIVDVLTEEEFVAAAKRCSGENFCVLEHAGKFYVADTFVEDEWDPEEPEESIFYKDLENIRSQHNAFYIPPADEVFEFVRFGWWPSREGWHRAFEWVKEYYMYKQAVDGMVSEMFDLLEDDEDEDAAEGGMGDMGGKGGMGGAGSMGGCNLDDVERDVNDKLSFAAWMMMSGNDAGVVFEQLGEVTADLEQEAKDNLISILEECRAQTNKPRDLGHWR